MDFSLVKKHPYAFGIGGIVLFILFYYFMSKGKSSGVTSTSGATSADLQLAQIQAGQSVQQTAQQAQLQAAQIQAGVQTTAIKASQDVSNNQTAAQLAAIQAQVAAQTKIVETQSQTQIAQTDALASIVKDQYDSQTMQHQATIDYLNNMTNAQATVALAQIQANQSVVQSAQQTQYELDTQSLSHIKDVGGSQNRTAIILGSTGNIPGSVAAANGQTMSSASSDAMISNIASSSAGVLSALFG